MSHVYSTRPRLGRLVIATLLAAAMVFVTMPPAHAAAPVFQERWTFEETHHDDFLSEVCGTDIYHSHLGKGKVKFYEDGRIVDHFNVQTTFWNPATGDVVIRQEAATFRGMGVETFDPETMTLTIEFEDTFVGLPSKYMKPGEGVLWRDAGQVTFKGTVVLDVSGEFPELISFEEDLEMKGPHPELTTDFDVLIGILCGALGA